MQRAKLISLFVGLSMLTAPALLGLRQAQATPGLDVVRFKVGCVNRIARKPKRARCVACVHRGGHFHKRGARPGFCHIRPVHGVIYTKPGCVARIGRKQKRNRCLVCIHRGGTFQKMGVHPGYCNQRR